MRRALHEPCSPLAFLGQPVISVSDDASMERRCRLAPRRHRRKPRAIFTAGRRLDDMPTYHEFAAAGWPPDSGRASSLASGRSSTSYIISLLHYGAITARWLAAIITRLRADDGLGAYTIGASPDFRTSPPGFYRHATVDGHADNRCFSIGDQRLLACATCAAAYGAIRGCLSVDGGAQNVPAIFRR